MPSLDDLLGRLPIADIAARLGVDEATASAAVEQALPALVSGLEANAQDAGGAASLEEAVSQHSPALVEGGIDLEEVDPADGEKIVSHIFGEHKDQVVATLSSGTTQPASFTGGSVVGKLLPILAPIVLSYLAKQFSERKQSTETAQPTEPMQSRVPKPTPEKEQGGLGGILGGLLGGGSSDSGSSGGIGEILGGLLGGDSRSSGGIGDVLGGLLGGGRK
ncbi:DUF937 domain-containing protein [Mycetocola zhadangensis]|uniref:DUF937 domain-containing protein n=1 Tax=Mycetocola zhadangensis TaxID=1164595 RepID=A0A3L7ISD0_9MICO|nr:DUF937 domain-containing protein [Mycetocola zhadangensis]RLQ81009.1 DUF937 domain-containing protein [Mycetocola zhadangensis]GGF03941.1 hypothetical protein GCM10011313_28780 [Mycetocola zhadangensis]